jgi:hypothetical protein
MHPAVWADPEHPPAALPRPSRPGASVIEVVVDKSGGADDARFAALAPGDTVEVGGASEASGVPASALGGGAHGGLAQPGVRPV